MPCNKCNSDFNILNWKNRCLECEEQFCSKCLKKIDSEFFCDICEVLIERPPARSKLMDLKSKDLQQYLNKHKVSTYGIVEKEELVELFYRNQIPVKYKKSQRRFSCAFSGSVPNLVSHFNTLRTNAESSFNSRNWTNNRPSSNSTQRTSQQTHNVPSQEQEPEIETFVNIPATSSQDPEVEVQDVQEASPQTIRRLPKLSDFDTAKDMRNLSNKQLKELLTLNRVDYKGCVEKEELLERANRLWDNSQIEKEVITTSETSENSCKICMDGPLDCVLLECGHIATCINCGKRLSECPICRQYVIRVVRTFKV